jgi:hypothetical protein
MRHVSSKIGFSNMKKNFSPHRQVTTVHIFLKSRLQKAPKSFFGSIAGSAFANFRRLWLVLSTSKHQHRSSEAILCRNQAAIASDRPLSVVGLCYPFVFPCGASYLSFFCNLCSVNKYVELNILILNQSY